MAKPLVLAAALAGSSLLDIAAAFAICPSGSACGQFAPIGALPPSYALTVPSCDLALPQQARILLWGTRRRCCNFRWCEILTFPRFLARQVGWSWFGRARGPNRGSVQLRMSGEGSEPGASLDDLIAAAGKKKVTERGGAAQSGEAPGESTGAKATQVCSPQHAPEPEEAASGAPRTRSKPFATPGAHLRGARSGSSDGGRGGRLSHLRLWEARRAGARPQPPRLVPQARAAPPCTPNPRRPRRADRDARPPAPLRTRRQRRQQDSRVARALASAGGADLTRAPPGASSPSTRRRSRSPSRPTSSGPRPSSSRSSQARARACPAASGRGDAGTRPEPAGASRTVAAEPAAPGRPGWALPHPRRVHSGPTRPARPPAHWRSAARPAWRDCSRARVAPVASQTLHRPDVRPPRVSGACCRTPPPALVLSGHAASLTPY
jgi:hypothetical protein